MKNYLFLIFSLLSFHSLIAQKNITLYNLTGTPQSNYANPGLFPKSRLYISFPFGMTNIGLTNSGFSFNDLFTKRADDSLVINTQGVIDGLDKLNYVSFESSFEMLGAGIMVKDFYFNLSLNTKIQSNFIYPKDLIQLAFEGNGKNFIGERVSMDGLGINFNAYTEIAFGATKKIKDNLSVGARFKLISGIANLNTKKSDLGLYTDPETFALTLDGAAEINTSNLKQFYDTTESFDPNALQKSFLNFGNKGFGFDFGANYKINDKISVSASVVDLGVINWKSNVSTYKTNDFKLYFDGINLNEYFNESNTDSVSNAQLERFADTLQKAFSYQENTDSYSTSLNTKIYLGGNYHVTKSFNVGALFLSQFIKKKYVPCFSLSANYALKNWLSATVNYSIINKTFNNIGVGLSLKGGPVQFYVMTDNILAFTNVLNARSMQLAFGMSFFIGEKDAKKKDKKEIKG